MLLIEPGQVTPALKSLFDPNMPTGIRCFAVLEGGNSGKILTDADMDVMGVRELGVTTQKAYRAQGFATLTCAHR